MSTQPDWLEQLRLDANALVGHKYGVDYDPKQTGVRIEGFATESEAWTTLRTLLSELEDTFNKSVIANSGRRGFTITLLRTPILEDPL